MIEPTGLQRDAASVLFNLPGYRVIDASDGVPRAPDASGGVGGMACGRRGLVESVEVEGGCPSCGVLTSRVHQVTLQRVRDVPVAGALEVVWRKRRFVCDEQLCPRRTFAEHTVQVPPRARTTGRLLDDVLAAVTTAGRTVSEVAAAHQVAWWTVQVVVNAAAVLLAAAPAPTVRRLGIDEHRYRSVKFFRDPATKGWRRYEPWMTTFVDLHIDVTPRASLVSSMAVIVPVSGPG